ncbi:MAG: hypothetical protein Tsb002_22370 [Wenzhouxiangellaceae bacterium]
MQLRLLLTVVLYCVFTAAAQAQLKTLMYAVDGEFNAAEPLRTSQLFRLDPETGQVLQVIGDTSERLVALAADPDGERLIALTAADSANPNLIVAIDPTTAQVSSIGQLDDSNGTTLVSVQDLITFSASTRRIASVLWARVDGVAFRGHNLLTGASELISAAISQPVEPGLYGYSTQSVSFFNAALMGCRSSDGSSVYIRFINATLPLDPPPGSQSFPLPAETCVTAASRSYDGDILAVGVPFAGGVERQLLRLVDEGDQVSVSALGDLPDDTAGLAFLAGEAIAVPGLSRSAAVALVLFLLMIAAVRLLWASEKSASPR